MKKIIIAMAVLLLLCGCEKGAEVPAEISETSQSVTAAATEAEVTTTSETEAATVETTTVKPVETTVPTETTAEETTADEQEYMTGEKSLLYFLDYLQNGAKRDMNITLNYHLNITLDYDFMDDFKIDSYSYGHRGDGIYDVKLTCSDSTCDIFPNGDSCWYANTNRRGNFYFCPAERENEVMLSTEYPMPLEKSVYTAYSAAANFTLVTGAFEADKEWFESYTDIDVHGFYHACNPYCIIYEYDEESQETKHYDITPEAFAAAVKKMYNVNMTVEQARLMTDESGFMIKSCGHGASWYYDTFAGYDETETEVKVRVNYCGDNIYFYPVIQSEYTFSKNADGSITLQKVEKVFDRGYYPLRDSV